MDKRRDDELNRGSISVGRGRGHYQGDWNFDRMWPEAKMFLTKTEAALVAGVQARCEVMRFAGLRIVDPPFSTSTGQIFDGGLYTVDENGRLHKEVGGEWVPQTHGGEPSYVVRV